MDRDELRDEIAGIVGDLLVDDVMEVIAPELEKARFWDEHVKSLPEIANNIKQLRADTHWWQGPCICDACGHAWQGVVEIPVETTGPQIPLECGECHQMTGGPV